MELKKMMFELEKQGLQFCDNAHYELNYISDNSQSSREVLYILGKLQCRIMITYNIN